VGNAHSIDQVIVVYDVADAVLDVVAIYNVIAVDDAVGISDGGSWTAQLIQLVI